MINTIKDLLIEIHIIMVINSTNMIIKIIMTEKEIAITKIVKELIEGTTTLKLSLKFL
jgi:hypothetical protein